MKATASAAERVMPRSSVFGSPRAWYAAQAELLVGPHDERADGAAARVASHPRIAAVVTASTLSTPVKSAICAQSLSSTPDSGECGHAGHVADELGVGKAPHPRE